MPVKILQMLCLLVAFLVTLVHAQFPDYCSRPSSVTSGPYTLNTSSEEAWKTKTATALIALHETLCYKVTLITKTGQEVERLYAVQYIGAEQNYGTKSEYNTTVPIISTECTCACPNEGKSKCASAAEECREGGKDTNSVCTVVMETGQTPEGCVWVGGEATTCCVVKVSPDSSTKATVVQLSSFTSRLLFNVTVLDLTNKVVLNPTNTLPLLDPKSSVENPIDEYFHLAVKLDGGQQALVTPGDYIVHKDKVYHFLGDQLNGLNDWDFNKLGWYKEGRFKADSLHAAMKIRTSNCGQNKGKIEMNGRYYKVPGDEENSFKLTDNLVALEKYFAARIGAVRSETRNVRVSPLSTRRVSVDFIFRHKTSDKSPLDLPDSGTKWLSDPSRLAKFTAAMVHDEYGNNVLQVHLYGAVGEIIGYIESGMTEEPHEDLTMHVPSGHDTRIYSIKQGVVTSCSAKTRICLKASEVRSPSRNATCHKPSCTKMSGRRFRPPNPYLTHTTIAEMSYMKLATWSRMGNPVNWFDNEFHYGELITGILYLVLLAVLIRLMVKTWRKVEKIRRRGSNRSDHDNDEDDSLSYYYGEKVKIRQLKVISESEGLEEFKDCKDVGYTRSQEDMLNDGSRREDWSAPRRFSTASL